MATPLAGVSLASHHRQTEAASSALDAWWGIVGPAGWNKPWVLEDSLQKGPETWLVLAFQADWWVPPQPTSPQHGLYYHGTDPKALLGVLLEGLQPMRPRHPVGIYSYACEELSWGSMYNQGAIISFFSFGEQMSISETKKMREGSIPQGQMGKFERSAYRVHGPKGRECIHHPSSVLIKNVYVRADMLLTTLSLLTADELSAQALVLSSSPAAMGGPGQKWDWKAGAWKEKKDWQEPPKQHWAPEPKLEPGREHWAPEPEPRLEPPQQAQPPAELQQWAEQAYRLLTQGAGQLGAPGAPPGFLVGPPPLPPPALPPAPLAPGRPPLFAPPPGHPPAGGAEHRGKGKEVPEEDFAALRQGIRLPREAVTHLALLRQAFNIPENRLSFCWKCYGMSFWRGCRGCLNLHCQGFGMRGALEQALASQSGGVQLAWESHAAELYDWVSRGSEGPPPDSPPPLQYQPQQHTDRPEPGPFPWKGAKDKEGTEALGSKGKGKGPPSKAPPKPAKSSKPSKPSKPAKPGKPAKPAKPTKKVVKDDKGKGKGKAKSAAKAKAKAKSAAPAATSKARAKPFSAPPAPAAE